MITESDKLRAQAFAELENGKLVTTGNRMAPDNEALSDYIDELRLELQAAQILRAENNPRLWAGWRDRCIKLLATQPEQTSPKVAACDPVDTVLATIAERGKVYGDPALSHHNIGLSWTGLLQQHYGFKLDHPLPDWLVELMLVAFKVHRAARVFHADNYVDARAYLKFAEEDQKKAGEGK